MDFIKTYMKYAEAQTGAPRIFHYYMAYAILAQVIGRRATFHRAGGPKATNFWFLLIGPSSMSYKSTALNIAKNILRIVYAKTDIILPHDGSYEGFIEHLEGQPQGIILHDELINFMAWMERSYNVGLMGLLTSLYDNMKETFTRRVGTRDKKKTYVIKEPFLNIVCCSTIEWLSKKVDENMVAGGFMYRFCLVRTDDAGRAVPLTEPPDQQLQNELVWFLNKLKDAPLGPMDYDEEAKAHYCHWFKTWLFPHKLKCPPLAVPVHDRQATNCHKFAMIHAILRGEYKTMNLADLKAAIANSQALIESGAEVITQKITYTPSHRKQNRFIDLVKKFQNGVGGAPRWKILRNSNLGKREFDDLVQTLLDANLILEFRNQSNEKNTSAKPCTFYKLSTENDE